MLAAFPSPVLCLAVDGMKDVQVFTKCKESLQDGRRLENISWRLWYREMSCHNSGGNSRPLTPESLSPMPQFPSLAARTRPPDHLLSSHPAAPPSSNPFFAGYTIIPVHTERDDRGVVAVPARPLNERIASQESAGPRSLGTMICDVLSTPQVPSLVLPVTKYSPPTPGEEPPLLGLPFKPIPAVNLPRTSTGSTPRNTLLPLSTSSPSRHIHPLVVNILTPTPNLTPHPTPPATPVLQSTPLDAFEELPSPSTDFSSSVSQLSLLSPQLSNSTSTSSKENLQADGRSSLSPHTVSSVIRAYHPALQSATATLATQSVVPAASPADITRDRRFFLKQSPDADESPERRDTVDCLEASADGLSSSPRPMVLSTSPQPLSPVPGTDPRSLDSHASATSRVSHTSRNHGPGHVAKRTLGAKHKPARPAFARLNSSKKNTAAAMRRAVSEGTGHVSRESSEDSAKTDAPQPPPEVKMRAPAPAPLTVVPSRPTTIDAPKSIKTAGFTLGSGSSSSSGMTGSRSEFAAESKTSNSSKGKGKHADSRGNMGPPLVPPARVLSPRTATFQSLQPLAAIRPTVARPPTPPAAAKPAPKPKAFIVEDDDDDFEDEEWDSEDASLDSSVVEVPARPKHGRNDTATKIATTKHHPAPPVKKSRRELAEEARQRDTEYRLLEAAEEAKRQSEFFIKAPVKSYSNLAELNRTQSGLLSQLLKPDVSRFPVDHPVRTMSAADLQMPQQPWASTSRQTSQPSHHSRQSSASYARPGLQMTKSSAALPVAAQVTTNGQSVNPAGGGAYRPKGRPQGMEMEDDTDSGDDDNPNDKIQLSRSVAHVKLAALASRRSSSKGSTNSSEARPSSSAALPPVQSPPSPAYSQPTAIPIGHPYNLPAPPPPSTPRTTRRNMLSTELSESLRRNLLWERSISRTGSGNGVPRRHNSSGVLNNGLRPMTSVLDQQKEPLVTPAVLPSAPLTKRARSSGLISSTGAGIRVTERGARPEREDEAEAHRVQRANARSWTNDYHVAGW